MGIHFVRALAIVAMTTAPAALWACGDHVAVRGGFVAGADADRSIEITSERDNKIRVYVDEHDVPKSVKGAVGTIDINRNGKASSFEMVALRDGTAMVSSATLRHGDIVRVVVTLPKGEAVVSEFRYTGTKSVAGNFPVSTKKSSRSSAHGL